MNDQEHKCKCDFRIRMLGDGCRYCQPQEYIDRLHDTMDGMIHTDFFELTDEEIKFIAYPFESVYTTYDKQTDTDTVHIRFDQLGFARAILKKAQE